MKTNKGQILAHGMWGIVTAITTILVYYFGAQAGIQNQFTEVKTAIATVAATQISQGKNIDDINSQVHTLIDNFIQLSGRFGAVSSK